MSEEPVKERSSYVVPATLGGAVIGAGLGARKGSQVGFGKRLGTRLKGLGAQWESRSAKGVVRRELLRRVGRLMTKNPKAYHALRGAGKGALIGGAVGLGAGVVAQGLKKESSMRFVLVKTGAKHHDALARVSMRELQEKAESSPTSGSAGRGALIGGGIGAGLGTGIGYIAGRSGRSAAIGGAIGAGAGGLLGAGIGAAKDSGSKREIEHARKFTKLPKRDQAVILAREHEESERQQKIDEENWKAQQEHRRNAAMLRVGGHVGSKLIRSVRGEETEDDQWKDKWASLNDPAFPGHKDSPTRGQVAMFAEANRMLPKKGIKKAAKHCPPGAKKKILIKHHEKDLREAVEEKDQNYAKKTVKDIEEIAADKHATLRPGAARSMKDQASGLLHFGLKHDSSIKGGVGSMRRFRSAVAGGNISGAKAIKDSEGLFARTSRAYSGRNTGKKMNLARASEVMDFTDKHAAEQYADELDMVEGCVPQFLNEAPVPVFECAPLPPLSSKLAYDQDGLKVRIGDDIVESMLKIAAKPPSGAASPFKMPGFKDGIIILPAPASMTNAVQEATKGTGLPARARTFGEAMSAAGENLWGTIKSTVTGEGGPTARRNQALLAGGLVLGAGLGIQQLYKRRQRQQQYAGVLAAVMDDPHFRNVEQKEDKVPEAYSFLRRYAPTLALDPVIARSFVRQAIESDVSWMNQTVAQGLSEAETKHRDANRPAKDLRELLTSPFASPFTGGKGSDKDK